MSNKQTERRFEDRTRDKDKAKGKNAGTSGIDAGRRRLIWIGLGSASALGLGLAGFYSKRQEAPKSQPVKAPKLGGKSLPPLLLPVTAENALRVCDEMLEHYTRDLNNPSAIIHAVRGFGKGFRLADGSNAVEHLCTRYALDKEVNGRRYVYFKREAEVHENSFLKTFLEAGVSLDQPVTVGDRRYTLRDVAESGKALFRCDPNDLSKYDGDQYRYDTSFVQTKQPGQPTPGQPAVSPGELVHEHLPWGIIAFSTLVPQSQAGQSPTWTNAYGEPIDFPAILDRSLAEYEGTCELGKADIMRGDNAPLAFRAAIKKYSCFGLHSAYSYVVAMRQGYTGNQLPYRVRQMLDLLTFRLLSDADSIDREYLLEAKGASTQLVDAFRTRAHVKLYGHAFEAINYVKLHKLIGFTPFELLRIQEGQQAFYESLIRLRGMDWAVLRRDLGEKFISDIVIALGHASRALKLQTEQNPDVAS